MVASGWASQASQEGLVSPVEAGEAQGMSRQPEDGAGSSGKASVDLGMCIREVKHHMGT